MDITRFKVELEAALVQELRQREVDFSVYELVSFDLGIHPWHGYIEPSFFTTQDADTLRDIGDWKLYSFSDTPSTK